MAGTKPSTELLDIESDDARELRLRRLLESQDDARPAGGARDATSSTPILPPLPQDETNPGRLSDLLARLDDFLPRLAAANAELSQLPDPGHARMELSDSDEHSGPYIQMDLGLGVFEQRRRRRSSSPADSSSSGDSSSSSSSSSSEDTTSDGESDAASSSSAKSSSDDSSASQGRASDAEPDLFDILLGQAAGVLAPLERPVHPLPRRRQQEGKRRSRIAIISSTETTVPGSDSAS